MRRPLLFVLSTVAASMLVLPSTGAAATKTHRATCDELNGTTFQRNDRWRVFGTEADTFNSALSACRRSARPVTQVLRLGAWAGVPHLADDLVQVESEGRYDNCSGYVIDLAARRATLSHDCSTPGREDVLLPSGTLVEFRNVIQGSLNNQLHLVGDITVNGGGGRTLVATGASDIVPFPATPSSPEGFYFTASDGTLQRRTTSGRADTTTWTSLGKDRRWQKIHPRVKTVPGRAATYVGPYVLRRERSRRGHEAALTVRYPNAETTGRDAERSDLLARLAPGSASEFRVVGGTFVGRFADDPSALRLWVPSLSKAGKPLLTLPCPADPAAAPFAAGQAVAFPTSTGVDLLQTQYYETAPSLIPVALPPGAHDLVATYVPEKGTSTADRRLLYTDASGRPASVDYRLPSA